MHRSFGASVLLALVLAACSASSAHSSSEGFPDEPYASFSADVAPLDLELRTAPAQPPERGALTAEVLILDRAQVPRDGLAVSVTAFMPAHGHGARGASTVTPLGAGRYRIEGLELSMPGVWELRFTFQGEGIDARATTSIDVR